MKKLIFLDDPTWLTTFPHRIEPLQDEWLFGLLLRCDEVNSWGSGTTPTYWLRATRGRPDFSMSHFVFGTWFDFGPLAQWLALPESVLWATTYYSEFVRLYGTARLKVQRHLCRDFKIRFCPECLAQSRLVRRTFILPQITACPIHQVMLLSRCPCGASLRSQTMLEEPFVCGICNTSWEDFPQIAAGEELLSFEQRSLLSYEFFFAHKTPAHLECARHLIRQRMRAEKISYLRHYDQHATRVFLFDQGLGSPTDQLERITLDYLVDMLVTLDISPEEILIAANAGDKFD